MKKIKDAIVLFVITIIAGLLLGGVNEITKDAIATQEAEKLAQAYRAVSPLAETFETTDVLAAAVADAGAVLVSHGELGNVVIEDAVEAKDGAGAVVGYVVKATSKDGYGGNITVAVGVSSEGTVTGMDYLTINETAGLGMKATEDSFKAQYKDKTVDLFVVTKSGAVADNEIDAISGATFTTNAVTGAVNAALVFVAECVK